MLYNLVIKRSLTTIPNHVKEFAENRVRTKCFDNVFNKNVIFKSHFLPFSVFYSSFLFKKWKILEATEDKGRCLVELKVDEQLANINKVIHGGALASLADAVSTIALYNTPVRKPGVSVSINISYIKPAKLNDTILIDGRVIKAGAKLAYLAADIYLKDKDSLELKKELLIATATHNKFIV
jgi:acyl-coenzyme A thioesterase 13